MLAVREVESGEAVDQVEVEVDVHLARQETNGLVVKVETDAGPWRQQKGSWRSRAVVYMSSSRFNEATSFSRAKFDCSRH